MEESQAQAQLVQLEAAVLQDVEQLAACPLADKPKSARLSQAVQEKLSQIRALTRDLELLYEELDSDEERQPVAALLTQHKAKYESIQQAFKAAVLAQRRSAAQGAAQERRELLAGAVDPAAKARQLASQADVVAASEGVTEGLRRTRQVLAEQLTHTSGTLAAMEESHAQLGKTKDEYHTQAGLLKTSKGLLGTLNWQQKAERAMMWVGLAIFMAVVAYIVQKRVGYFLPAALQPSALMSKATGYMRGGGLPKASPLAGSPPGLPPHFEHRNQPPPQQSRQQEDPEEDDWQPMPGAFPPPMPAHVVQSEPAAAPPVPAPMPNVQQQQQQPAAAAATQDWHPMPGAAPPPLELPVQQQQMPGAHHGSAPAPAPIPIPAPPVAAAYEQQQQLVEPAWEQVPASASVEAASEEQLHNGDAAGTANRQHVPVPAHVHMPVPAAQDAVAGMAAQPGQVAWDAGQPAQEAALHAAPLVGATPARQPEQVLAGAMMASTGGVEMQYQQEHVAGHLGPEQQQMQQPEAQQQYQQPEAQQQYQQEIHTQQQQHVGEPAPAAGPPAAAEDVVSPEPQYLHGSPGRLDPATATAAELVHAEGGGVEPASTATAPAVAAEAMQQLRHQQDQAWASQQAAVAAAAAGNVQQNEPEGKQGLGGEIAGAWEQPVGAGGAPAQDGHISEQRTEL